MAQAIDLTLPSKPGEAHVPDDDAVLRTLGISSDHPALDQKCLLEVLELICCAVGAKAAIAGELANLANRPSGVSVLRNLLKLAEILGKLNFGSLSGFARELDSIGTARLSEEPPSLWQLFRKADHPDVRRGLALLLQTTQALGKAVG